VLETAKEAAVTNGGLYGYGQKFEIESIFIEVC
jgi:hypothetical protein